MGKVKSSLVWSIDLQALIGRRIVVETYDGHYSTGTLSGIEWSKLTVLGDEWEYPKSLIMNPEESDGIPWTQIKSVRLAKRSKA